MTLFPLSAASFPIDIWEREIVGPIAAKWGLARAGEVGNGRRNHTEPIPAEPPEIFETS